MAKPAQPPQVAIADAQAVLEKEDAEEIYSDVEEQVDDSEPIAINPYQLDQTEKEEEAPL